MTIMVSMTRMNGKEFYLLLYGIALRTVSLSPLYTTTTEDYKLKVTQMLSIN